jgi:hypothetical protein
VTRAAPIFDSLLSRGRQATCALSQLGDDHGVARVICFLKCAVDYQKNVSRPQRDEILICAFDHCCREFDATDYLTFTIPMSPETDNSG